MWGTMNLQGLISELNASSVGSNYGEVDVTGGYMSDMMSDVLANAKKGSIWVTNQKHVNVVAVASLLGLAGVIIAGGIEPDGNAVEKAHEEKVALFVSELPAFEIVGRLYSMGVRSDVG